MSTYTAEDEAAMGRIYDGEIDKAKMLVAAWDMGEPDDLSDALDLLESHFVEKLTPRISRLQKVAKAKALVADESQEADDLLWAVRVLQQELVITRGARGSDGPTTNSNA
jgi:hypothetical protein